MQYSFISAAILALVSSVVAQTSGFDAITSPTQDQNIPAGSSFDIVWQPGTETGDITITLLQGADPSHLVAGPVVAKSISNSGKFTWTVPTTSSFATYGFEITLDSSPTTLQYSFPFHITGGSSSSASGSASATGTGSTTTVHLSTGPSYTTSTPAVTSTSTTSVPSSTSTVISTSSSAGSSSGSATLVPTHSSNITLSTTLSKATSTSTKTSATGSSTSSSASPVSTNAAATHIAGSLAMVGGIVLALAL